MLKDVTHSSVNTTYGALSCELAFLHNLAICFTLVVQSATKAQRIHTYRATTMACLNKTVGKLLTVKSSLPMFS